MRTLSRNQANKSAERREREGKKSHVDIGLHDRTTLNHLEFNPTVQRVTRVISPTAHQVFPRTHAAHANAIGDTRHLLI